MKYMVVELLFTIKKAWVENDMICLLMSDNKEIRFRVEANKKLKSATENQRKNIEIIWGVPVYICLISMKTFRLRE